LFAEVREREGLAPLWKYLTFTQNLGLDLRYHGTFSHAWSLCIEEQFYFCFPLILAALIYFKAFKKGIVLLLLLFLAGFAARLYAWNYHVLPFIEEDDFVIRWYKWIYYPTYSRLDGLLIGISIAAIFQFKPKLKERIQQYGNWFILAGLVVFAITYFLCSDEHSATTSLFGFTLVDLGYGLIVVGAVSPTSFLYKLKSKGVTTVATLSYALYLTHKIVIHITQQQVSKLGVDDDSNLMFFICIITSLLGAYLVNKSIEKPFLKLRDKVITAKTK
jgi:peptidoglycan/LPS O-acetylase OafA/YrhL